MLNIEFSDILENENYKALKNKLGHKTNIETLFDLLPYKQDLNPLNDGRKLSQAAAMALNDAHGFPLLVLTSFFGSLAKLGLLSIAAISTSIVGVFILATGFFFYANYNDYKKETKKLQHEIQLACLQLSCYDMLKTKQNENNPSSKFIDFSQLKAFDTQPFYTKAYEKTYTKIKLHDVKSSINTTLQVGSALFAIHFFGVCGMLTTLGLTTAATLLTGPVALGIAIGVALTIGSYVGYKHYTARQDSKILKKVTTDLKKHVNDEKQAYRELEEEKNKSLIDQSQTTTQLFEAFQKTNSPTTGSSYQTPEIPHDKSPPPSKTPYTWLQYQNQKMQCPSEADIPVQPRR